MSLEERHGVVERLTEHGVVLGGTQLNYSKWFEGDRLTEAHVGQNVTVVVDVYKDRPYLKRVTALGEKVQGFKPPAGPSKGFNSFGGGYRRMSPEELELKRAERVQIARSVAVDRAITMTERGIPIEKIAPQARLVEEYLLTGKFPVAESAPSAPPAPSAFPAPSKREEPPAAEPPPVSPPAPKKKPEPRLPRPKKAGNQAVNALFNDARRYGFVANWMEFVTLIQGILKTQETTPYDLSAEDFAKVESSIRPRLRQAQVA